MKFGNCSECGLRHQKEKGQHCGPARPTKPFNGIMIIGEGPGHYEVAKNTPFVGPAGRYLTAFLEYAGIDRDACYITNATLCLPRIKDKSSLHKSFPTAIPACLSRLEEEIEEVQPRVIITLGAAALIAITGYDKPVQRRRERNCDVCNEKRRVGPVIQCSKCGHNHWFDAPNKDAVDPELVAAIRQEPCPTCGGKRSNLRPKMIKCPVCKGRKTETYTEYLFTYDYKISEIAGAIFVPGEEGRPLDSHELQPWYGECGVKYVIGTYHPSFIQRGNQFYAEVVVKHLARAKWLLTHDVDFNFEWSITTDPREVWDFCDPGSAYYWDESSVIADLSLDIETEAWGTDEEGKPVQLDARKIELVTHIKCIGIERDGKALVVDTRNVDPDDPDDPLLEALYEILTSDRFHKTYQNGMCYDIPVIDMVWGIPWDEQIDSYTDDTLTAYHALYPDEPSNLAHITFAMTRQRAWKPPRTVKGAEVHTDFDELALYNARDVINTGASRRAMGVVGGKAKKKGLMDREGLSKVYEIDSQLNRIAVTMTMRGMALDAEQWVKAGDTARERIEEGIQQARDSLVAIGFPRAEEFNPFKTANDLVPALYNSEGFNFAVTKRTAGGQPTTDKNTIIDLMSQASSVGSDEGIKFLKALTNIRDAKKTLSTYIEGQRPWNDGRLHYQWKPYGTKTGRFSSSPNCFDGETEVLTPSGWLRFDELFKSSSFDIQVAQYDLDGKITFVKPIGFVRYPLINESLHYIHNQHIDLMVTGDHRCLLQDRKTGKFKVVAAQDYLEDRKQINAGYLYTTLEQDKAMLDLSEEEVALVCATQADGTYTYNRIYYKFTKRRKVRRLLRALRRLDIDFTVYITPTDQIQIGIEKPDWLLELLPEKQFTWNMLFSINSRTRERFCDEIFLWDGLSTRKTNYSSSVKANTDWVQALLTLSGYRAKQRVYRSKGVPNQKPNYQLDITHNCTYSMTTNVKHDLIDYDGYVYCVKVPSSYLLVRRNGRTMMTGNCQNWPKWMKAMIVAPEGRIICGADYSQLELRALAALAGDPEMIRRCLNADESRKLEPEYDPHSYIASVVFRNTFTDLDLEDKKRSDLRTAVKSVIYGLNYGAGDQKTVATIYGKGYDGPPITVEFVRHVRKAVFSEFRNIPKWQEEQIKIAAESAELRSPIHGRRRVFPCNDQQTIPITEVKNYPIQSIAADLMNEATLSLDHWLPEVDPTAFIFAQVHDALYVEADENKADQVCKLIEECMTTTRSFGGPEMIFNAAAKASKSWKEAG